MLCVYGVIQILVSRRLFGTSLMFGVASTSARLHVDAFVNLLGEDERSWALSHKGTLWHRGRWSVRWIYDFTIQQNLRRTFSVVNLWVWRRSVGVSTLASINV